MNDPFEALEQFYRGCDQALPPDFIPWSRRLLQQGLATLAGGLTPFLAAFAAAAFLLSALAGSGPADAPRISAFPASLKSAGFAVSGAGVQTAHPGDRT